MKNPPFCFFQNKVGCPFYPYKNFEQKKATYNFEKFGKTFLSRLPSEVAEKAEPGKRNSVIMLDTPLTNQNGRAVCSIAWRQSVTSTT